MTNQIDIISGYLVKEDNQWFVVGSYPKTPLSKAMNSRPDFATADLLA